MEIKTMYEGQKIYAVPTGNNARYTKGLVEGVVEKVGRKYATIRLGILADRYCPKTGATESAIRSGHGLNGGFIFFSSKKEYQEWEYRNTVVSNICGMVRHLDLNRRLRELSESDLRAVESILAKVCD